MEKERSLRIETTKVAFAERVFAERVNILIKYNNNNLDYLHLHSHSA